MPSFPNIIRKAVPMGRSAAQIYQCSCRYSFFWTEMLIITAPYRYCFRRRRREKWKKTETTWTSRKLRQRDLIYASLRRQNSSALNIETFAPKE
eukprot:scaffold168_cov245-Pinguiococcus_pyrenoidosus.AAC.3